MRLKHMFALLGVALLPRPFILAIVLAAMGTPENYLMAVIFSPVFIPTMLYVMGPMTGVPRLPDPFKGMDDDAEQTLSNTTDADLKDEL